MTEVERQAALDAIGSEVSACTRCRLHETRTKAVPGEGTSVSEVVLVGEGPAKARIRFSTADAQDASLSLMEAFTAAGLMDLSTGVAYALDAHLVDVTLEF